MTEKHIAASYRVRPDRVMHSRKARMPFCNAECEKAMPECGNQLWNVSLLTQNARTHCWNAGIRAARMPKSHTRMRKPILECQFANAECENALQEFGHSHVPNADLIFRMPKGIRECEICHWRMANPNSQNADWRLRMRNRSFWELCGMVHLATSTSSRSQNLSASTSTCCWCLDTTNFPASNPYVPHYDGYSLIARVPYLVL